MKSKKKSKKKAIVKSPKVAIAAAPERPWILNTDEIAIVKNSIAKGCSDEELKFCLTVARRYKLDPFRQQIWFVKRWDKNADNGKGGTGCFVWNAQVGINGLLFAAARDHKADFGSVSIPTFGNMVKQNGGTMAPEWARVKVFKRGGSEPTEAEAWWSEYAPLDLDKAPFWRKMPRRMLGKCATALAIRQAYPDLGGLYIPEENERMNEKFTASGREILTPEKPALPARKLTEEDIVKHDEQIHKCSGTPWREGRISLTGPGVNIFKAEVGPEVVEELDIRFNTTEKVVHMAESKWFTFVDTANAVGVEATLAEAASS